MKLGWRAGLVVAGALIVIAGCRSEPEWIPAREPVALPTTTSTTTVVPAPSTTTTVPSIVFPGARLTSCVNAVQFGAFSGDADLSAVWESAGGDASRVRSYCRDLADDDPASFVELGEGWLAVEKLTPTTSSLERADELLVIACVERVEWGTVGEDPMYLRIWDDVGQDDAVLGEVCAQLVLDDPVLAGELADEVEGIEAFLAATAPTTLLE